MKCELCGEPGARDLVFAGVYWVCSCNACANDFGRECAGTEDWVLFVKAEALLRAAEGIGDYTAVEKRVNRVLSLRTRLHAFVQEYVEERAVSLEGSG